MEPETPLVCLLLLAAALSGCLGDSARLDIDDDRWAKDVTIEHESPVRGVVRYQDDDVVWDMWLNITDVTPDTTDVRWADLNVSVSKSSGEEVLARTPVAADDRVRDGRVRPLFDEAGGDDDTIDGGDVVIVTAVPMDAQGGELVVHAGPYERLRVPVDTGWILPLEHEMAFRTGAEVVLDDEGGETVWTLDLEMEDVAPDRFTLQWPDVEVRLRDTAGGVVSTIQAPPDLEELARGLKVRYYQADSGLRTVLPGDGFYFVFETNKYQGGTLEFVVKDQVAASIQLPEPFPEERITVNLASPTVQRETRVVTCWDTTLNVNRVTPKDARVPWTQVRVLVRSSSGSVMNRSSPLAADSGSYHNYTEFWYVEVTSGDDGMSAGDAIKITGMGTRYEGATVELTVAGVGIGSITLPTNFP